MREALKSVGDWPVLDQNWSEEKVKFLKKPILAPGGANNGVGGGGGGASGRTGNGKRKETTMKYSIETLLGKIRGDYNQPIIVEQYVGPDDRNSSLNIIQFDQTTLGLPSREYFLKAEENKEKQAYLDLMVDMAELLGADRAYATEEMAKVLDFETELANVSILMIKSVCPHQD